METPWLGSAEAALSVAAIIVCDAPIMDGRDRRVLKDAGRNLIERKQVDRA